MIRLDTIETPRITVTGDIPRDIICRTNTLRKQWEAERNYLIEESRVSPIVTGQEVDTLLAARRLSLEYFQKKKKKHDVGFEKETPEIIYLDSMPLKFKALRGVGRTAGFYAPDLHLIGVIVDKSEPEWLLHTAMAQHHEIGHAEGASEVRMDIRRINGEYIQKLRSASGFARFGGGSIKGRVVEEGLVSWDQLDFMTNIAPKLFTRSINQNHEREIESLAETLSRGYAFTMEEIRAFVTLDPKDPDGVLVNYANFQVLKLTQTLARYIGSMFSEMGPLPDSEIDAGRILLDSGRFNSANVPIRTLTETLGGSFTQEIMNLPSWPVSKSDRQLADEIRFAVEAEI